MPSVLSSSALTSLDNAKEKLGVPEAVTDYDNKIERLINRASAEIERLTNRKLKARNYNGSGTAFATTGITSEDYIHFSGSLQNCGGDTLVNEAGYGQFYLPQFPIQTVSPSITFALHTLEDREAGDWDTSLVENREYVIDRETGLLTLLYGRFSTGFRNYRITCTAGYLDNGAQPYVPYDLEELCLAMMKKLYRGDSGLQSETLGTWSRSFNVQEVQKEIDDGIALFTRQRL